MQGDKRSHHEGYLSSNPSARARTYGLGQLAPFAYRSLLPRPSAYSPSVGEHIGAPSSTGVAASVAAAAEEASQAAASAGSTLDVTTHPDQDLLPDSLAAKPAAVTWAGGRRAGGLFYPPPGHEPTPHFGARVSGGGGTRGYHTSAAVDKAGPRSNRSNRSGRPTTGASGADVSDLDVAESTGMASLEPSGHKDAIYADVEAQAPWNVATAAEAEAAVAIEGGEGDAEAMTAHSAGDTLDVTTNPDQDLLPDSAKADAAASGSGGGVRSGGLFYPPPGHQPEPTTGPQWSGARRGYHSSTSAAATAGKVSNDSGGDKASFEMTSDDPSRHTWDAVTSAAQTVGQQLKARFVISGDAVAEAVAASAGTTGPSGTYTQLPQQPEQAGAAAVGEGGDFIADEAAAEEAPLSEEAVMGGGAGDVLDGRLDADLTPESLHAGEAANHGGRRDGGIYYPAPGHDSTPHIGPRISSSSSSSGAGGRGYHTRIGAGRAFATSTSRPNATISDPSASTSTASIGGGDLCGGVIGSEGAYIDEAGVAEDLAAGTLHAAGEAHDVIDSELRREVEVDLDAGAATGSSGGIGGSVTPSSGGVVIPSTHSSGPRVTSSSAGGGSAGIHTLTSARSRKRPRVSASLDASHSPLQQLRHPWLLSGRGINNWGIVPGESLDSIASPQAPLSPSAVAKAKPAADSGAAGLSEYCAGAFGTGSRDDRSGVGYGEPDETHPRQGTTTGASGGADYLDFPEASAAEVGAESTTVLDDVNRTGSGPGYKRGLTSASRAERMGMPGPGSRHGDFGTGASGASADYGGSYERQQSQAQQQDQSAEGEGLLAAGIKDSKEASTTAFLCPSAVDHSSGNEAGVAEIPSYPWPAASPYYSDTAMAVSSAAASTGSSSGSGTSRYTYSPWVLALGYASDALSRLLASGVSASYTLRAGMPLSSLVPHRSSSSSSGVGGSAAGGQPQRGISTSSATSQSTEFDGSEEFHSQSPRPIEQYKRGSAGTGDFGDHFTPQASGGSGASGVGYGSASGSSVAGGSDRAGTAEDELSDIIGSHTSQVAASGLGPSQPAPGLGGGSASIIGHGQGASPTGFADTAAEMTTGSSGAYEVSPIGPDASRVTGSASTDWEEGSREGAPVYSAGGTTRGGTDLTGDIPELRPADLLWTNDEVSFRKGRSMYALSYYN